MPQLPPPNPPAASKKPDALSEDTDLERRVLAHERILQSLIAHLAVADPRVLERLRENFSDRMRHGQYEQDFTDTDSYADRFIAEVTRIGSPTLKPEAPTPADASAVRANRDVPTETTPAPPARESDRSAPFRTRKRQGIWHVTKCGSFFGNFFHRPHADAAVEKAGRHPAAGTGTPGR